MYNLQLIRQFIYHYPLKVNPLINPLARNANFGWYNTFRKHVTMSTSSSSANLVLIGDFIIANFCKCNNIFDNFFLSLRTWNFRISGGEIQNVLWCGCYIHLPALMEYIIIHCGTNILGHNSALKITERLININYILKEKL